MINLELLQTMRAIWVIKSSFNYDYEDASSGPSFATD